MLLHAHFSEEPVLATQYQARFQNILWDTFQYFLAPIESNTDGAMRCLAHQYGADYTFTEMVRVIALNRRNKSTWQRLNFPDSTPVIIQLLTAREDDIKEFLAHFIPPEQGCYGFNLNCSCPSMDIVKSGMGCALIKRPAKVQHIIDIFREFHYPISIKIRLGLNAFEKHDKVYLRLIQETSPDFFVVHARHAGQKYIEPADFKIYQECVGIGKIIVANGDIHTTTQIQRLQDLGVKGAMLGRSALANPTIFLQLRTKLQATTIPCATKLQTTMPTQPLMKTTSSPIIPPNFNPQPLVKVISPSVVSSPPIIPSMEQIRHEYLVLTEKYKTPANYQEHMLRRLGQNPWTQDAQILR